MKAYLAAVTDRDRSIFLTAHLSFSQFDDYLAIVNVDGKEQFFDPGARYCPYQHLVWKHTQVGGIRQIEGGFAFVNTPGEGYTYSRTQRLADLSLDQQGAVTGIITMIYSGSPAVRWRQRSLTGDATSIEQDIRTSVEERFLQGLKLKSPRLASSTTMKSHSSSTCRSAGRLAPPPASVSSSQPISSKPTPSPPSPTRSVTSLSTFNTPTSTRTPSGLNFQPPSR